MTLKEIRELIKLIHESDLAEFNLKDDKFELSIKTNKGKSMTNMTAPVVTMSPPVAQTPIQVIPTSTGSNETAADQNTKSAEPEATEDISHLIEVKSPIIGTFYRSPSPDKPPFIKVGDTIKTGDVVCIVEAMKLFNEIESEVSGKIVKVLIEDAQPVEYDTPLFLVDPQG